MSIISTLLVVFFVSSGPVFAAPLDTDNNRLNSGSSTSAPICGDNSNCGAGDPANGQKESERLTEVGNGCANKTKKDCLENNPIVKYLNIIVDVLAAGVGVVVVGVIILGGIQYSLAGDNPSALTAARQRMMNGLIALLVYAFIFSFLQWIVPGGVFNS